MKDGRVGPITGTRRHAWTDGYICAKVRDFGARVHGPDRILHPMIRDGGGFRRATWDEALDRVTERLESIRQRSGPEAILPVWYAGSNGHLTAEALDLRFWNRLGATVCERTLCASNTGAGKRMAYGGMLSADPADVAHADLVVLWGMNPVASGIHLVKPLRALQKRGGKLIVVDPRRTQLAASADLHLPVLPGTDVPLALALIRHAFTTGRADLDFLDRHAEGVDALREAAEPWAFARAAAECGVDEAAIARFADLYAAASPALVRCGWGMERNRNGSDSIRAALLLPAVYGKFGVRGGGYVMSTSAAHRTDISALTGSTKARSINLSQLGRALEETKDPRIEAVFVYNCNPMATVPEQTRVARALRDDRFVVVHEQVWTDTCDLADVVLPATTFLEHRELTTAYGGHAWQWAEPVIPPVGEARSNHALFEELGRRLGIHDPLTEEDIARAVLANAPGAPSLDELRERLAVPLPHPVQFVDTFPEGRIQLSPPPRHRPLADAFPLTLVTPSSPVGISSTLFEGADQVSLGIHPEDARTRGLEDGANARVWNTRGEVQVRVQVDPAVRTGVVSLPKGAWRRSTANGWTANALIPDHVDEYGGGACYNDARVEVAPA